MKHVRATLGFGLLVLLAFMGAAYVGSLIGEEIKALMHKEPTAQDVNIFVPIPKMIIPRPTSLLEV